MIFKEREPNGIGRGVLPDDAVLLDGCEPALEAAELKVVARDDYKEGDGETILFAVGVDATGRGEALLDRGEERLLVGWSEARAAGERGKQVRGVGGGVDPALGGVEATRVALVAQVSEGAGEQARYCAGERKG